MPLRELPEPKGPLAERTTADGRRRLKLNQDEREAFLTSTQIDRIVHMVLNIEEDYTYGQMAEELEISVPQLKNLMRTPEFQDRYNEYFMELGKDPRVRLTQAKIAELLPKAFMTMKKGLEDPEAPWTAKVKIVEKILELSGIERPQTLQNDRKEFEQFWEEEAGEDDRIRISIPAKFAQTRQAYERGESFVDGSREEVVDGEVREVQSDVG
jgi:hypothetical protein